METNQNSSTAQQRAQSRADVIGHSSVQPWSAGAIFPCVIATIERYNDRPSKAAERGMRAAFGWADHDRLMACMPLEDRFVSRSYELIAYGRREEYATREDAERVAVALNADAALRAKWCSKIVSRATLEGYTAHLLEVQS